MKANIVMMFVLTFLFNYVSHGQSVTNKSTNTKLPEIIVAELKTIQDPELDINVYDLGLIRKINISATQEVVIEIIFTSLFCPYGKEIVLAIKNKVGGIQGVKSCKVNVDIKTAWKRSMLTEEGKTKLKDRYTW